MTDPAAKPPLFVDLDGTLIKTDSLLESVLKLTKRNPLFLLLYPFWLMQGRAGFKQQVAKRVSLAGSEVPVNEEFHEFLRQQQDRELILISASNQKAVDELAQNFDLFASCIGSSAGLNLRGHNKLEKIQQLCEKNGFAYAGNSSVDLPIWEQASEVLMVNCPPYLRSQLSATASVQEFDAPLPWFSQLLKAMRPHQWLKNGLLFVPLILAHQANDIGLLAQATIAFISFSLCATSVYLLNDLMDLDADRQHRQKKNRPFAAGTLSLQLGIGVHFLLLLTAFALAFILPAGFVTVLLGYWVLTVLYTVVLKRILLLDLIVLAQLYTIRLVAGAAAVSVVASPWLLGFSMALFFSLGIVKRVTELINADNGGKKLPGRAYRSDHRRLLTLIGTVCSLLTVTTVGFYINSEEAMRLYSKPMMLWPICILLFLILYRLWGFALGGKLEEDPVLFAISDHPSQVATVLMFLVLYLAI